MTGPSFSKRVKEELCEVSWGDLCCIQAEIAGVLMTMGRFRSGAVTVHTAHAAFADRLSAQLSETYDADVVVEQGRELLSVTMSGEPAFGCLTAEPEVRADYEWLSQFVTQ